MSEVQRLAEKLMEELKKVGPIENLPPAGDFQGGIVIRDKPESGNRESDKPKTWRDRPPLL